MHPTHAEASPDESVHANTAPVQVTRITLPPARDLLLGTLLGLALLCDVFLYAYAKDAKTQAWVAQDALQKFMTNQLPDLQARIEVAEELTKAYGLKESADVNHHHQPVPGEKAVGSH